MPEKGRRERVCVKQGKRREIQAFLNTVGRRQKQARGKKHKKVAEIKSTRVLEGKTRRSGKQVEGRAFDTLAVMLQKAAGFTSRRTSRRSPGDGSVFPVKWVCLSHEPEVRKAWKATQVGQKSGRLKESLQKAVKPGEDRNIAGLCGEI